VADRKLVDDPAAIIRRFPGEFEKLLFITLMSPWGQELNALQVEHSLKSLGKPAG